jgi:hypothetical protein
MSHPFVTGVIDMLVVVLPVLLLNVTGVTSSGVVVSTESNDITPAIMLLEPVLLKAAEVSVPSASL